MCYMDYQNLRMWNANCWKWSYKANSVLQYFSLNNFCIVTLLQYECLIVFMVVHFVVLSLLCQCICIFSPKATKVRLNYVLFVSIIKVSGDSVRHTVVCFQSAPQMNEMFDMRLDSLMLTNRCSIHHSIYTLSTVSVTTSHCIYNKQRRFYIYI